MWRLATFLTMLNIAGWITLLKGASFEIEILSPIDSGNWYQYFISDEDGILLEMRQKFNYWEKTENELIKGEMEELVPFRISDRKEQMKYLGDRSREFFDRKLKREIARARERGGSFRKVEAVQNVLRPGTQVKISKAFEIKIDARPIHGRIFIRLLNPYIQWNARVDGRGDMVMELAKDFPAPGVNGQILLEKSGPWTVMISKKITQDVSTSLSSIQNTKNMAFLGRPDHRVTVNFLKHF